MNNSIGTIIGAALLAFGIAMAGYFASQTLLNKERGANTASVKGLSERLVPADNATWVLELALEKDADANVSQAFQQLEAQSKRLETVLTNAGFESSEISLSPIIKSDFVTRNDQGEISRRYYVINTQVKVATQSPRKVVPARGPVFALAKEGIFPRETRVSYNFTKLNDIKPDMLREATENARIAANEFAKNAGVKVGGIQFASQGGFQIYAAQNDRPNASEIDKLVRVVTNITFYLEN